MSRIFDALAKSTGGAAELARRWMPQVAPDPPEPEPIMEPVAVAVEAPVAVAEPALPEPALSEPAEALNGNGQAHAMEVEQEEPAIGKPRLVEWRPPMERNGAKGREWDRDWEWERPAPPRKDPPKMYPPPAPYSEEPHPAPPPRASAPPPPPSGERHESGLVVHLPKPSPAPAVIRNLPVTAASDRPILPFDLGDSVVNEGYRKIRTQLLQTPTEPRVIVISSPSQGDGKTLTSINLAGALALKHDINCVLLDADLRRGDIAASCGLPEGPGLGDYLSGRCRLEDALIRVQQLPNLFVITSGEYRTNPVELLDSPRWLSLLDNLRERFRFVIIDVPPMGSLADYDLVEAASDGVILVVRQDHTTRNAVHSALQSVPPAKRLGIIMNAAVNPSYARRAGYGNHPNSYSIYAGR